MRLFAFAASAFAASAFGPSSAVPVSLAPVAGCLLSGNQQQGNAEGAGPLRGRGHVARFGGEDRNTGRAKKVRLAATAAAAGVPETRP